jgi:hypothetical protein
LSIQKRPATTAHTVAGSFLMISVYDPRPPERIRQRWQATRAPGKGICPTRIISDYRYDQGWCCGKFALLNQSHCEADTAAIDMAWHHSRYASRDDRRVHR